MSTTSASRSCAVRQADANQSSLDLSEGNSPYRMVTVTRSYESVVRQIADSIRSGQIGGGERLPTERELSLAFGVSRGVVREAIKVLGALGLVEVRQGSGIYVLSSVPTITRAFTLSVSPNTESVERLFEFRRTLEVESATLAALRRSDAELEQIVAACEASDRAVEADDFPAFGMSDNAFHVAIARASGNPYFEVAVATARQMQSDVVPLMSVWTGSLPAAVLHHRSITEAIAARDSEAAGREMGMHIAYTADAVVTGFPRSEPIDSRTAGSPS